MGITNFCKLIQPIAPPSSKPDDFDSVIIDCQSYLYVAIEKSLQVEEEEIFQEICESVWNQLKVVFNTFLSHTSAEPLTFVLSFDGEGVPMKWATQRERRRKSKESKKNFYRYILFGDNKLTARVQDYVLDNLKEYNRRMKVVLSGCNVPGEGEHKIFQVAEKLGNCQNPIVVSVDQDVFVLSFLRLHRYRTIQIFRYNEFYNVHRLVSDRLPYPLKRLTTASFLFGNDFVPPLIGITTTNPPTIHRCLASIEDDVDPPALVSLFIQSMQKNIRFTRVEFVDDNLMVWFWTTYLWILDYYTLRSFPQQFLQNHVYDAFDRNQLLTGLMNATFSREMFRKAETNYEGSVTQPVPDAERHVFVDSEDLVCRLKSYWIKSKDQLCIVMHTTDKKRKKARSQRI